MNIPGYAAAIMLALRSAQKKRGGPVYYCEIHDEFKKTSYHVFKWGLFTRNTLFNLYSDDLILANKELTMYSIDAADQSTDDHETEFELYSDRMARIAPDLEI
jgi:hypothetical protein